MPQIVLADSDDDGDDEIALDPRASGEERRASGTEQADQLETYDGANEQSTGSTERLQRQIRSAERGLFASATIKANSVSMHAEGARSSGSPSAQANKRRHTAAFESASGSSLEDRVKRTRTLEPLSNKQRISASTIIERPFAPFRGDGGHPMTSQTAKFTEHSGTNSSIALPAGSVQADFVNHEPNVMFRESGSTVADNESSQQRLVEQVLASTKGFSTSVTKLAESDEPNSWSFPWSTSEQRQSANTKKTKAVRHNDATNGDSLEAEAVEGGDHANQASEDENEANHPERTYCDLNIASKPRSSPMVHIPCQPDMQTLEKHAPASTQKASRGRRCKVQYESSEPLNSEDVAVGLPKERYNPRPTRRRATQLLEEPIDYSVRPERAAKVKRTKTTTAASPMISDDGQRDHQSKVSKRKRQATSPEAVKERDDLENVTSPVTKASTDLPAEAEADIGAAIPGEEMQQQLSKQSVSKSDGANSQPPAKLLENEIFVKPTTKPKSSSRVKRSQTTIFEDHVELSESQPTPTLRQQQAIRKSALASVENEATQLTPQKRRKFIDDKDDENEVVASQTEDSEDVNVHSDRDENAEELPKQRGRGRPPTGTKLKPNEAEKIYEDDEVEAAARDESKTSSKQRRCGRPAKATAAIKSPAEAHEVTQPNDTVDKVAKQADGRAHSEGNQLTDSNTLEMTPAKSTARSLQAPTPSPEKPRDHDGAATTPKLPSNASPTSHSPIKSSLNAPLRVGLSKRHRIPPLLRMTKPPKR